MGDLNVGTGLSEKDRQAFMRALLADIYALERILDENRLETDIIRIGAEQEMFLIDARMRPKPIALDIINDASDPRLTSELALFNLEANLSPQEFSGSCFKALRGELEEVLARARATARARGADILLAGILPTLKLSDLGYNNMTPHDRYYELDRIMRQERGGAFEINIRGRDELQVKHENVMLESCNTSLQLHLQVNPEEVSLMYNIAQAITGPLLAAAVNSPLLLNKKLWSETRVALFEHSIDHRSAAHREKGEYRRVHFGDDWLRGSALTHFRENISRFRPIMRCSQIDEDPKTVLERGELPNLSALRLHNGTIYRWNRLCYGLAGGKGHLRIENRVLPSGPSVTDEVANAAFFFGMMSGLKEELAEVHEQLRFDDAKENFFKAARHGLDAQVRWIDGKSHPVAHLILNTLLPAAQSGLEQMGVDSDDISHYLGVLETRVRRERTGARWVLDSLVHMQTSKEPQREVRNQALVHGMMNGQSSGAPVAEWPLAEIQPDEESWRLSIECAGQIMTSELFSARSGDIIDLAANLMDWQQVRHVPVEGEDGTLAGLISHRAILRVYAQRNMKKTDELLVRDIMQPNPVTVTPQTPTLEVMTIMKTHNISALPVIDNSRLVGIITERDLMRIATRVLKTFFASAPPYTNSQDS